MLLQVLLLQSCHSSCKQGAAASADVRPILIAVAVTITVAAERDSSCGDRGTWGDAPLVTGRSHRCISCSACGCLPQLLLELLLLLQLPLPAQQLRRGAGRAHSILVCAADIIMGTGWLVLAAAVGTQRRAVGHVML
jgi:hypothetical protein